MKCLAFGHDINDDITFSGMTIHKILHKDKWRSPGVPKHLAKWPLGDGRPGLWEVSVPRYSKVIFVSADTSSRWIMTVFGK